METDQDGSGAKGAKSYSECTQSHPVPRMGKKARLGARKDGTAAPAEKGGQTARMRKEGADRGHTSRADARKEQVDLAWSETVGELKEIIKNSGMSGVIESAVDADEFRDLLALWQTELRTKGIKQEFDGLPFPTFARIAFNLSSETGAAPCKHDVEYWATDHPLAAAFKAMLKTVTAQRDGLLAKLGSGVGSTESASFADFGTLPASHTPDPNRMRRTTHTHNVRGRRLSH